MNAQLTSAVETKIETTSPRRVGQSIGAVVAGFVVGAVLSLGTDQVLHTLAIYPPWGQPMNDPGLNLLALAYRCVFNTAGFYVMARLAPRNPQRHVAVGAVIGFLLSSLGVVAAMTAKLGPTWYPVLLALATFPCAWIATRLDHPRHTPR